MLLLVLLSVVVDMLQSKRSKLVWTVVDGIMQPVTGEVQLWRSMPLLEVGA